MNFRNKIEISQRNLAKSIDILHKINPKINNSYIRYCPLNQKFVDLNTGKGYYSKKIKDYKYKLLKNNIITENILNYKPIITEESINNEQNKHPIFIRKILLNKKDNNYYRNNSNNDSKKDYI